jgi:ABC-type transport system involved in multi-copper enzyme maturation permease subunit
MTRAVYAEWTKLRTVRSTGWLVLAAVGLSVATGALATWSVDTSLCATPTGCDEDTVRLSLLGTYLGQVAVVVLAALAATTEYDTNLIRLTLAADPRRLRVLAAKAAVVTMIVLAVAAASVLGSLAAARGILPGNGFTAANGYPPLSLGDGPTLRAYGGTVLYFGLIGLLSLGVGMAVRHTAGALGTVLAILFVLPIVAAFMGNDRVREQLLTYAPMTAGLAIQATRRLGELPIGPWAGLGVLAGYAAGAMVLGAVVFAVRDA